MTIWSSPSAEMHRDARRWLEITLSIPDGEQQFQSALKNAVACDEFDARQAISLAYAAIFVAGSGQSMFATWYSEKAGELLARAYELLTADRELIEAGTLN